MSHVLDAVFVSLKQNLMQMHCFFKSAIIQWWITLNTQNNKPLLVRNRGLGLKNSLIWLTEIKNEILASPSLQICPHVITWEIVHRILYWSVLLKFTDTFLHLLKSDNRHIMWRRVLKHYLCKSCKKWNTHFMSNIHFP